MKENENCFTNAIATSLIYLSLRNLVKIDKDMEMTSFSKKDNECSKTSLSRRWRPQLFCNVLGQEIPVEILRKTVCQSKTAPAYILSGTRGSGKTSLARIFAKALNCSQVSPNGEPCNCCSTCTEIQQGSSLQVVEIDGASHRGIDDVRSLIETCQYAPDQGGFRVYIIDEVHMLTKEAFNALLKTLEEPPSHIVFILATTDLQKVPKTITSRCLQLYLKRIPNEIIAQKISRLLDANQMTYDTQIPFLIAERSEGSLRDSESILEQIFAFSEEKHLSVQQTTFILGAPEQSLLLDFDKAFLDEELQSLFSIGEQLFHQSQDGNVLLRDLSRHYQNHAFFLSFKDRSMLTNMSEGEADRFIQLNARFTANKLSQILSKIKEVIPLLDFSPQIIFRTLLVELSQLNSAVELSDVLQTLEKMEVVEEKADNQPKERNSLPRQVVNESIEINEKRKNARIDNMIQFFIKETNSINFTNVQ
ncbi:DNA polymerase III subunit gamma/tau [Candidatus Similichlamydia epinepheli]|uniref:DNA polymerase III subunit gamma/tau n=1 Tax=Candidatus Similichlamydia epinepheli TaxID=1903953 RepID=UPI000D39B489|nr:DNA polymerase III subunit gamma/tau [Candidatus Similichlamydia epinepheli]